MTKVGAYFLSKMNYSTVLGIKIGQETAEKELFDKNWKSGPECNACKIKAKNLYKKWNKDLKSTTIAFAKLE